MVEPSAGRQTSYPSTLVSLILTVAAILTAAWLLVTLGESEVAAPLWVLCGCVVTAQCVLLGVVGKTKGSHAFFVVCGINMGLAAAVAVLAYVHSVNW